jgi:tetratricopeptide (TPR) repeat protein
LIGLGNLAYKTGRLNEALDYYQQSLEIRQKLGDRYGEGLTLANIGRMHAEQGDIEQAADLWLQAQQVLTALNVPEAQEVEIWLTELEKDVNG